MFNVFILVIILILGSTSLARETLNAGSWNRLNGAAEAAVSCARMMMGKTEGRKVKLGRH